MDARLRWWATSWSTRWHCCADACSFGTRKRSSGQRSGVRSAGGRRLLQPELVHIEEGQRILGLEHMPVVEVDHRRVVGEAPPVGWRRLVGEAEESEAIVVQEGLDLWKREFMLLHVEQQVAATADRE